MKKRVLAWAIMASILGVFPRTTYPGSLQNKELQTEFQTLIRGFEGRVGICARTASRMACVNPDERFALQSVMKLLVSLAVMDRVDQGGCRLDEPIVVRKEDLSLYVQPMAKLVTERGFRTTLGDLVRGAIVDSDSAAADVLVRKLGGPNEVQAFLDRHSITNVRFDRDERHLQTEIVGLEWRSEFLDPAVLNRAIESVPEQQRDAAYHLYQTDMRDTASPSGMACLLYSLSNEGLLSPPSTKFLLDLMTQTVTFHERLKAGVSNGWKLGHKTGTSNTWKGVTAATNDVGILTGPTGQK